MLLSKVNEIVKLAEIYVSRGLSPLDAVICAMADIEKEIEKW